MNPDPFLPDSALTPSQVTRLQHLTSFDDDDVALCERALVESRDVNSEQTGLVEEGALNERRFSNARFVGSGAYGVVFFVHDALLRLDVAIKLLRPSRNSPMVRQRFLEEARITANLSHPGIVRLYDSGTIGGIPYITSSLADAGSLASLLRSNPQGLDSRQTCEMMLQVADAVAYAHSKATFHRDLKPGNILLQSTTEQPHVLRPVVSDFGMAKRWNADGDSPALTVEGDMLGTVRYMSPEQAGGDMRDFAITSEVFTLGIILYEMLTGQHPFSGAQSVQTRRNILELQPQTPSILRGSLSRDLDAVVMKCLEKEPHSRYESVSAFAKDLRRYLNGEPVEAARPSMWRRTLWLARKHPITSVILGLSICIVTLSLLGTTYATWRQTQAAEREFLTKLDYIEMFGAFIDDVAIGKKKSDAAIMESLVKFESRLQDDLLTRPDNPELLHLLSVVMHYKSTTYTRQGDLVNQSRARVESAAILKKLYHLDPANTKYRFQYIYAMALLTNNLQGDTRNTVLQEQCKKMLGTDDAKQMSEETLGEIERLRQDHPEHATYMDACNSFTVALAICYFDTPRYEKILKESASAARELSLQHPDKPTFIKPALQAYRSLANDAEAKGQMSDALKYSRQEVELAEHFLSPRFDVPGTKVSYLESQLSHIGMLVKQRRYADARPLIDRCGPLLKDMLTETDFGVFSASLDFMLSYYAYTVANALDSAEQGQVDYQHLVDLARQYHAIEGFRQPCFEIISKLDPPAELVDLLKKPVVNKGS